MNVTSRSFGRFFDLKTIKGCQSGLEGSKLDSRLKGCHPAYYIDENGVEAGVDKVRPAAQSRPSEVSRPARGVVFSQTWQLYLIYNLLIRCGPKGPKNF